MGDARADLIAERVDIAIRGGPLEDSGLFARKVLDAGIDGAYIAARGAPRRLQDLADHDRLGFGHASGRVTWQLSGPGETEAEVQVAGRLARYSPA